MISRGYVKKVDPMLVVNVPVFTREEFTELIKMMDSAADEIAKKAEELWLVVTKILQNHVPVHLKQKAKDIAYLRLFEDAISAPVAMLYKDKILKQCLFNETLKFKLSYINELTAKFCNVIVMFLVLILRRINCLKLGLAFQKL